MPFYPQVMVWRWIRFERRAAKGGKGKQPKAVNLTQRIRASKVMGQAKFTAELVGIAQCCELIEFAGSVVSQLQSMWAQVTLSGHIARDGGPPCGARF